jgi:hypothetical protein
MSKLPQNPQSNIAAVTCRCKKIVIERYVAILENGEEIEIRGIPKSKLKDGMELTGIIKEDERQLKYSDGTYSRSYIEEKWLQVNNGR